MGEMNMIYELERSDFYRCKDLLSGEGNVEVNAIIEGNNTGRVFVDNITSPRSGLVLLGNNDGSFLIGDTNHNSFNELQQFILEDLKTLGMDYYEVAGTHPFWNETILTIFNDKTIQKWTQKVFKITEESYLKEDCPNIEGIYQTEKLTKAILTSNEIINSKEIRDTILESWRSIDEFLQLGIGYCAIYNHEIVSVCFSNFVAGNKQCIHIETNEAHRGKQLAKKLAHLFVQDCFIHDLLPYWDCTTTNVASVTVAESVGFVEEFTYDVYGFRL